MSLFRLGHPTIYRASLSLILQTLATSWVPRSLYTRSPCRKTPAHSHCTAPATPVARPHTQPPIVRVAPNFRKNCVRAPVVTSPGR
ncbi:hypothetical protein BKA63DRAFT_64261 [Paraphoma chrysanthemicola]|nr:hypothetical protein BKA63DRAFT_64261 [Paraphoma chrysanthemicola]